MSVKSVKYRLNIVTIFAIVGVIEPILYWILLLIAQALHPGYDPIKESISKLAFDPNGLIQTINFFLLGCVVVAFAFGLYLGIPKRRYLWTVTTIMVMIGVAQILLCLFKTEYQTSPEIPMTVNAMTHHAATDVSAIFFTTVCFLIVPTLRANPQWKPLVTYTIIAGVIALVLEIGWAAQIPENLIDPWFGLYERVLLSNGLIWLEVIAIRLLVLSKRE